jgi:hypothetical protein
VELGNTMEENAKWTVKGIAVQAWICNTKPREKEMSTNMISKEEYTIHQQGIVSVFMCVWMGIDCDGSGFSKLNSKSELYSGQIDILLILLTCNDYIFFYLNRLFHRG